MYKLRSRIKQLADNSKMMLQADLPEHILGLLTPYPSNIKHDLTTISNYNPSHFLLDSSMPIESTRDSTVAATLANADLTLSAPPNG
jgi:hypothetical protein